jgi:hypothetical protein
VGRALDPGSPQAEAGRQAALEIRALSRLADPATVQKQGRFSRPPRSIANQGFRGRERDKKGFDGIMDEVRVMPVERSADWAKLDYESQKEGSKFVSFGETQTK